MYPILGRYGPFFLYSFTVVWGIGGLIGLGLARFFTPVPKRLSDWFDPLLVGGIAGIFGGRLLYIWHNQAYFTESAGEWWQLQLGGLSYFGVVGVGVPAIIWWGWRRGHWQAIAGTLAVVIAWLHLVGWVACYLEGCGFGLPASLGWFVADLPDNYAVFELRYQTQLLAIGWHMLIFGWAFWAVWRQADGVAIFWLTWLLIGLGNAGITLLRGDLVVWWAGYPAGIWANGCLIILSLILFYRQMWQSSM